MTKHEFAALMDREIAAAHAAMDEKERRLDTYGYGGGTTPLVSQDYGEAVTAAQEPPMTYCCINNTCARCVAFDLEFGDYTRFVSMWRRIAECYAERFVVRPVVPAQVRKERQLRNVMHWKRGRARVESRNMPDLPNAIPEDFHG